MALRACVHLLFLSASSLPLGPVAFSLLHSASPSSHSPPYHFFPCSALSAPCSPLSSFSAPCFLPASQYRHCLQHPCSIALLHLILSPWSWLLPSPSHRLLHLSS